MSDEHDEIILNLQCKILSHFVCLFGSVGDHTQVSHMLGKLFYLKAASLALSSIYLTILSRVYV